MRKERFFNITQLLTGLTVAVLLFLFSQIGAFNNIYSGISTAFIEFRTGSYLFFSNITDNFNFLFNIDSVKKERDMLLEEKITLTSENTLLKEQLHDNAAIVKQLSFNLPYELLPVRVLGYNENKAGEIFINKGSESGLKNGGVIVYQNYAIGEITEILSNSAKVRLLTAIESLVPVISVENQVKGVMTGDLAEGLIVREILIDKGINVGDTFVTAGINSNFPYGLIVGKVSAIDEIRTEITKQAKLANIINFNDLHDLFVIIK